MVGEHDLDPRSSEHSVAVDIDRWRMLHLPRNWQLVLPCSREMLYSPLGRRWAPTCSANGKWVHGEVGTSGGSKSAPHSCQVPGGGVDGKDVPPIRADSAREALPINSRP